MSQSKIRRSLQIIASAVLLCCMLASLPPARASSPSASLMTNSDVIQLSKDGFGDQVIEAKIRQAPSVDFKLGVSDLKSLMSAGVSQNVISAMLKRSTAGATANAATSTAQPVATATGGVLMLAGSGSVSLLTHSGRRIVLHSIGGSTSSVWVYFTSLIYANYPGLKSAVRIHDRRPTIVVKSTQSPEGRLYLVSAEVDRKNDVRSVKLGNSRLFGAKNIGAPDSDNQIPYIVAADGAGTWRLTPSRDLAPGEYGLWASTAEMYGFGVDP